MEGKSCKQDGVCKCTFDDGSGTIDLSPLGKQDGTALIQDQFPQGSSYAYSFNPCYPFTEGTCVNAAGCQVDATGNVYYNIGDAGKVTLAYDGTNLIGTYTADDGARTSKVTYKCDPNADPSQDVAVGETQQQLYEFTITSKYCCPQGSDPGPGPGPGPNPQIEVTVSVSVGSVLLIVFFALAVVYLVAGILFNKFARHNTGKEVVPNVSLWVALPGLVKDGCLFVVGKITRRGGYERK